MPPRTRRAPAPLPPAAALQLPPSPSSPARDGLITVAAAIALAGAASIQGVATGLVIALVLGGLIAGTGVGIASARKAARADMRDRLVEALGPLLSAQRLDRRTVRLSNWGSGWPGSPARVSIRYNPRAADSEPAWLSNVLEVVGRRLLQPYECAEHDQRRCRLELRPADRNAPKTAPIVIRAERAMSELIGSTAKLTATDVDDDGVLKSFEVAHENGARLAVSGYRDRVERVISTMNTGRWRAIWNLEKDTVRFEQRPTLPRSVWLPTETPDNVDDLLANYRSVKIPYAVDEDGNELYWQPGVTPQAMVVGGTGTGKRLALSTPIPTPTGTVTMGDLEIGDQVLGRDGRPCRVTALSPIESTPQLFRITFSDGQSVAADLEHQWLVSTRHLRKSIVQPKRKAAVKRFAEMQRVIDRLETLAASTSSRPVTLRELADFAGRHVPGLPWAVCYDQSEQLSTLLRVLDMVDCPYVIQEVLLGRAPGPGLSSWRPSVRVYDLPIGVKAMAQRLAEQFHTPPVDHIVEQRLTTGEMLSLGVTVGPHRNFAVRGAAPLQLPPVALPVDPYVLGAWLGDGTSCSGGMTSVDPEVIGHIEAAGYSVGHHPRIAQAHYIRGLLPKLRELNVLRNKHVPTLYLRSSIEQRLALLQGLMDTDGTIAASGSCEISLSDPVLAEGVAELLRTLGILVGVTTGPSSYRSGDGSLVVCKTRTRIKFRTTAPVFRLRRKLERVPTTAGRQTNDWLYITSIEPLDPEPARCITVDSPDHTYLCGGFIPTSNTSTAHALLGKITQMGWPVWVSDAKRVEFLGFRDWPNVQIVAGSIPQQVALVHRTWLVMENRYRLIEEGKATVNDFEPLVVFLDEFAEFRSGLLEWYPTVKAKGDPSKPPTLAQVASLARKARTARIHLVLATQRPDAEFLGGEMRDNFGQRMSMGRLSPQGAMMMWENPTLGVALPRGVTGRAVAVNPQGVPVEAQAYRFPDPDSGDPEEQELLRKLRPKKSLHPRLVIVPPEGEPDLDTGEPAELTFTDYANAEWDTAENRPDLDPLQQAAGEHDGRALSSTMASLGIGGMSRPSRQFVLPTASDPTPAAGLELDVVVDDYEGYQQPEPLSPTAVSVGDLIEIDEGSGVWVVVDEEPEPDPADPGLVAISWRGDGDESGSMSIPDDDAIPVRRPEEYFDE